MKLEDTRLTSSSYTDTHNHTYYHTHALGSPHSHPHLRTSTLTLTPTAYPTSTPTSSTAYKCPHIHTRTVTKHMVELQRLKEAVKHTAAFSWQGKWLMRVGH